MTDLVGTTLLKAAEHVDAGWCQTSWALDAAGERVMSDSPDACRWCAGGAVSKAAIELLPGADKADQRDLAVRALKRLAESLRMPTSDVVLETSMWNDTAGRTGKEVAMKLRRAAE